MAHSEYPNEDIAALSLHVLAASSEITKQTIGRSTLATDIVLETIELTTQIIQQCLCQQKKLSHQSKLDAVLEDREEEFQRDSQTKECFVQQQHNSLNCSKNEVILEFNYNENRNPNLPQNITSNTPLRTEFKLDHLQGSIIQVESQNKIKPQQQFIEQLQQQTPQNYKEQLVEQLKEINEPEQEYQLDSPPKKRQSIFAQQLSQIKVDKAKEAEEEKELMNIVQKVDPLELIPKLQQMKIFDESKQVTKTQDVLVFPDKSLMYVNPDKQAQLMESQPDSPWYASSSVEYRATSYNTNESSNMDHHSYKWKSESKDDDNFLQQYGIQFESSVFDFPYPAKFDENQNDDKNQLTPKKPRLYCNNKKVPRWAENLEVVSKYQNKQKNERQSEIFGRMKLKILGISKQFSERKNPIRGSSAHWKTSTMNSQLKKLLLLQDENKKKMKQFERDSAKANKGFFARTHQFFTSLKKKIMSSFEKKKLKQLTEFK